MSFLNFKENVFYIGNKVVQISKDENKLCYLYSLELDSQEIKSNIYIKRITKINIPILMENNDFIKNEDYFFIYRREMENKCIVATVDKPLIFMNEKVRSIKRRELTQKEQDEFSIFLTYYYAYNELIEDAKATVANLGEFKVYGLINSFYSLDDKKQILDYLLDMLDGSTSSYNISIRSNNINCNQEQTSLLQVLYEIMNDEESKLLWDHSYPYNKIATETILIEDNYRFIKPIKGYGEVTKISMGEKKLNVGLKVKVCGQVINDIDDLMIDAYIYREYNIVIDGNYNIQYLNCKLSQELKGKYSRLKIIKERKNVFGEEIIILDLYKLEIINKNLIKGIDKDIFIEALYKVEELNCRQRVLRPIIKELEVDRWDIKGVKEEKEKVRRKYRVDSKGVYYPIGIKRKDTTDILQVYVGRILEFKIDKFPKKQIEEKWKQLYREYLNNKSLAYNRLKEEYALVKSQKIKYEFIVNMIRLYSGLKDTEMFLWDKIEEKYKKEYNKELDKNMIIGDKIKIFTKCINDVTFRQEKYLLINKI